MFNRPIISVGTWDSRWGYDKINEKFFAFIEAKLRHWLGGGIRSFFFGPVRRYC